MARFKKFSIYSVQKITEVSLL